MPRPAPSREIQTTIAELYTSGYSCESVAKQVGYSETGVRKILYKLGIPMRSRGCRDYPQYRKYKLNHQYFDVIDTEEKAYWLGFVYAAGTISTNGKGFSIFVRATNRAHIEKFKSAIGSTHPLAYRTMRFNKAEEYTGCGVVERVGLSLSSTKLVSSLNKHGISNNRLADCLVPNVPRGLVRHFWRGLFDGDGRVTTHKTMVKFRIRCTKNIALAFARWADPYLDLNLSIKRSRSTRRRYVVKTRVHRDTVRVVNALYLDAGTCLLPRRSRAIELGLM